MGLTGILCFTKLPSMYTTIARGTVLSPALQHTRHVQIQYVPCMYWVCTGMYSCAAQPLALCRSRCTKYQIEMSISLGSWGALQEGTRRYVPLQGSTTVQAISYYTWVHTIAALCHTKYAHSLYSKEYRVAGLLSRNAAGITCTEYVLSTYCVHDSMY